MSKTRASQELKAINNQIKILEKQLRPLKQRRREFEDEKEARKNRHLIGKCFIYNVSEFDESLEYLIVISLVEDGPQQVKVVEAQKHGSMGARITENEWYAYMLSKFCKRITRKTFDKHFNEVKALIAEDLEKAGK